VAASGPWGMAGWQNSRSSSSGGSRSSGSVNKAPSPALQDVVMMVLRGGQHCEKNNSTRQTTTPLLVLLKVFVFSGGITWYVWSWHGMAWNDTELHNKEEHNITSRHITSHHVRLRHIVLNINQKYIPYMQKNTHKPMHVWTHLRKRRMSKTLWTSCI